MATRTVSAAGGNWNSTATWAEGVVPTAADDVVANIASGNLTITAAAASRSFDGTLYSNTLTLNALTTWTVGDATAGANNSAMKFSSGMTFVLGDLATSALVFASTNATQQAVDFAGKNVGNITFSGTGGNWALLSNLVQDPTASVTHSAGTLNWAGTDGSAVLSHSIGVLTSTGSVARSAIFGASTVTTTRNGASSHINYSGSNITFSGASATFIGAPTSTGRITYQYIFPTASIVGNLILNGQGERSLGNYTIINLTRNGTANYWDQVNLPNGGTTTVTGSINLIGAGADYRMTVWPTSTANPAGFKIAGATRNFQYIDWQDVIFDNGGADLDLSNDVGGSGDCGGNAMVNGGNLTFTAATTQTWQGTAGGNWNDVSKWTSRVPLCQDNVVIGTLTGSPTITVNRKWVCRDINMSTGTGAFTLAFGSVYETYFTGNWTARSGLVLTNVGGAWRCSIRTNAVWNSNGMAVSVLPMTLDTSQSVNLTFSNGYVLGGALTIRCGVLNIPTGYLFAVGNIISSANLSAQPTRIIGGGTLSLRAGSGSLFTMTSTPAFTSFAGFSGVVQCTSAASGNKTIMMGGIAWPDIQVIGGGAGVFVLTGGGSLPRMPVTYTAGTASFTLGAGTTTVLRNPANEIPPNGTNVISVKSDTAGTPAIISKANGRVQADYYSFQDITFTGNGIFVAGANSTNVSGNTGLLFASAKPWVVQAMF